MSKLRHAASSLCYQSYIYLSILSNSSPFVDLQKAYDSIPRKALWHALEKLGVPNSVVNLVKSFHDGMKAQLSINGELLEEKIDVDNGLRQGCTMAPTLFNLYACLMMVDSTSERHRGSSDLPFVQV